MRSVSSVDVCLLAALFLIKINEVFAVTNLKEQIFVKLSGSEAQCIRLLNGTGSAGCQSNRLGNIGALTEIVQSREVQKAVDELPSGITDIIAVVDVNDLNGDLIDTLRSHDSVAGIIFIDREAKTPKQFSEDAACPNQQFSFYEDERSGSCHGWNQKQAVHPSGLKFINFNKPIRLVENSTEIELLTEKCVKQFNKKAVADGFRCIGRITQVMLAAGNAKICLERKTDYGKSLCDVLQDQNVFAMFPPLSQEDETVDQFVLATRLDSFSIIRNAKGGDLSALSSIISLLLVGHTIGQQMDTFVRRTKQSNRQLLLAFLHGESLGYIGSSRWIWDMEQGQFPGNAKNFTKKSSNIRQIGMNALSFYMELQQIGTSPQLYAHTDKKVYAQNETMIDQILNGLKLAAPIKFVNPNLVSYGAVPPSSYHSILKTSVHVPGLILSSFGNDQYNYSYLNSFYDNQIRVHPEQFELYLDRIIEASSAALEAALSYVFKTDDKKVLEEFKIDRNYSKLLCDCFFKTNWSCSFFRTITNATNDKQMDTWLKESANVLSIGGESYSFRVMPSIIKNLVFDLLVNSTGDKKPAENVRTQAQCRDLNSQQSVFKFEWLNDDRGNASCYRTSIYLTAARSPAFEIEDYDFASGKYSTWVASNWDSEASFELYLKADYRLEFFASIIAFIVLMLSIPLHYAPKEQWFLDNFLPPGSPQPL